MGGMASVPSHFFIQAERSGKESDGTTEAVPS